MIELHAEAPKIIVPLFARTLPELTAQAAAAQRADAADLVELRLDPLPRQDWPTALAQVRAAITKPLIVTIRTAREGGEVDLTPTEYGEACQALLAQGDRALNAAPNQGAANCALWIKKLLEPVGSWFDLDFCAGTQNTGPLAAYVPEIYLE